MLSLYVRLSKGQTDEQTDCTDKRSQCWYRVNPLETQKYTELSYAPAPIEFYAWNMCIKDASFRMRGRTMQPHL